MIAIGRRGERRNDKRKRREDLVKSRGGQKPDFFSRSD